MRIYNPWQRVYRAITVDDALTLLEGSPLHIEPYQKSENASYRYENVIGHGGDRREESEAHEGVAMIGFDPGGFEIEETGRARLEAGSSVYPREEDNISITGTLNPEAVDFMVFRFPNREQNRKEPFEFAYFLAKKKRKGSTAMSESPDRAA